MIQIWTSENKSVNNNTALKMPEMESVESVGATSRGSKLTKFTIQRNTCGPEDVTIDIKYSI